MAEGGAAAAAADDDDEEVVWEGSPLHEHLRKEGFATGEDEVKSPGGRAAVSRRGPSTPARRRRPPPPTSRGLCAAWPESAPAAVLEVEVARRILGSELLVAEDEDFLAGFVLTEEALEAARAGQEEMDRAAAGGSGLGDALLISGSLAAAAATVLYLSERTRLAATVASVLPTALAAATAAAAGGWSSGGRDATRAKREAEEEKEQFERLVETLLADMRMFKRLVRKSLNLLQGMELMQSGYVLAVSSSTGGTVTTASGDAPGPSSSSGGACFPALRRASYQATVELIGAYRQSVERLMEVSPLADHVDLREHYVAFVDLGDFGIDPDKLGDSSCGRTDVTVKELKDAVQLTLVQQSEYLRRFALSFSDKVRDDGQELDKAGLLRQVRGLVGTLRKINHRLSRVFEYHQAMGVVPSGSGKKMLASRKHPQLDLVPLRSVYTSLFSTGLHLQNSLLKVRQLEKAFDRMEKGRAAGDADSLASVLPSEGSLADWLASFETIQRELNACVGCLDEGMSSIGVLKNADGSQKREDAKEEEEEDCKEEGDVVEAAVAEAVQLSESTQTDRPDEVFEAVITDDGGVGEGDGAAGTDELSDAERARRRLQTEQSERVLRELRSVLVGKAREMERREEEAIRRRDGKLGDGAKEGEAREADYDCQSDLEVEEELVAVATVERASAVKKEAEEDDLVKGAEEELVKASTVVEELVPKEAPLPAKKPAFEDSFSDSFHLLRVVSAAGDAPATAAAAGHNGDDVRSPGSTHSNSSSSGSSSTGSSQATVRSVASGGSAAAAAAKPGNGNLSSSGDSSDGSSSYESDDSDEGDNNPSSASSRSQLRAVPSVDSLQEAGQLLPQKKSPSASADQCHSLSELRSVSSPDIKKLASEEGCSSPYVSLERLPPTRRHRRMLPQVPPSSSSPPGHKRTLPAGPYTTKKTDGDESSDGGSGGSADEMAVGRRQVLRTFKRPLRPAAAAPPTSSSSSSAAAARRSKRDRNRTVGLRNGGSVEDEEEGGKNGATNGNGAAVANGSSYAAKHHTEGNPLFLPPAPPLMFDAAVALQAARKAVSGFNGMVGAGKERKEEVFGSSSSDSE